MTASITCFGWTARFCHFNFMRVAPCHLCRTFSRFAYQKGVFVHNLMFLSLMHYLDLRLTRGYKTDFNMAHSAYTLIERKRAMTCFSLSKDNNKVSSTIITTVYWSSLNHASLYRFRRGLENKDSVGDRVSNDMKTGGYQIGGRVNLAFDSAFMWLDS